MSQNENLKKVSKGISTKWRENAEYRSKNKWLTYSSKIARRILAAIDANPELNQAKLASLLNVSPQQISKIVKGKENLTLETIYNLSQALSVELISFPNYQWNTTSSIDLAIKSNNTVNFIAVDNMSSLLLINTFSYNVWSGTSAQYALNKFNESYLPV